MLTVIVALLDGVGLRNTCFVHSMLRCIFHTSLLRGITVENGSELQHHELYYCSYKNHTVLIVMNCTKKMIDNIGYMFCLLGTLQNLRIQCECVMLL